MKQVQFFAVLLLTVLFSAAGFAQQGNSFNGKTRIYIVRHAEKETGKDPLLTADGNKRAGDLMRELKSKGIKRIYVSEFRRTQNTADSMRLQLGIDTVHYAADTSCIDLFKKIAAHKDWGKPILIVTHSNIVQKIIYKTGLTDFPQENIPDSEFDNLYFISFKNNQPILKHSKYGKPSAVSATMQQMK